jgi:molecular chaperone GrpE
MGKNKENKGPDTSSEPSDKKKGQLAEVTDLLKRNQAEFENYKKQQEARSQHLVKMAAKNVILQVLPIIDNFELALKNCEVEKNQKDFCDGVELIYAQLNGLLDTNDVKVIESKGKFDPYFHEALMKVDSDVPENEIVEEFQKGYMMHGQVIRHSKVKVSSGKKNSESDDRGKVVGDGKDNDKVSGKVLEEVT